MKQLSILAVTLTLAGCGLPDAFRDSLPTENTTKLVIPDSTAQGLSLQTTQQGLQGQTATFYTFTRDMTLMVNGATVYVLDLLQNVTQYPPSSRAANQEVWGPYTDPLSPNTIKLTVTQTAAHTYTYELDGKAKTAPDSAYVAILTGTATPSLDAHGNPIQGYGSGSFTLNWDNEHTLPENDGNVGTGAFQYSKASATSQVTVQVTFTNVLDKSSGQLINANYAYDATPGQGGTFQFSEDKDFIPGPNGNEHMAIESRWLESGAGRSDVKLSGGDVPNPPGQATANECWDSSFVSQYLNASWDPTLDYGTESANCSITPAQYSTL